MQRFAVMGRPVAQSLSPRIHQAFARQAGIELAYEKIEPEDADFETEARRFFAAGGSGLNVTSPFKEKAFRMADVASPLAKKAGASNTLFVRDRLLYAENTDGPGFISDIQRDFSLKNQSVLLVGAGGAARGIIQPLLDQGIHSLTVSNRSMQRAEELKLIFPQLRLQPLMELDAQYDLIIQATSAAVNQQRLLLPEQCFANQPYCYDLAYQLQNDTPFIAQARTFACAGKDGLGMLVEQAALAFEIWHGIRPDAEAVLLSLRKSDAI